MLLELPSEARKAAIAEAFANDLQSYTHSQSSPNTLSPVVCSICDGIPTCPNWAEWVDIMEFKKLCDISKLHKRHLPDVYNSSLISSYTAEHPLLTEYVLSPMTQVNLEMNTVLCCKKCLSHLEGNSKKSRGERLQCKPPKEAIFCGYLLGEVPEELFDLNEVELAVISKVRIYSQTFIFFGGCHQQIRGWHTFFRNRSANNVASIGVLANSGMHGNIMVILSGPFTPLQTAITKKATQVDAAKVRRAWFWLKNNNYHYKDDIIPNESDIPQPILIDDLM